MNARTLFVSSTAMLVMLCGGYRLGKQAADRWYAEQYGSIHTQIIGMDTQKKCRVWAASDQTPGAVMPIDIPCSTELTEGTVTQIVKPRKALR